MDCEDGVSSCRTHNRESEDYVPPTRQCRCAGRGALASVQGGRVRGKQALKCTPEIPGSDEKDKKSMRNKEFRGKNTSRNVGYLSMEATNDSNKVVALSGKHSLKKLFQ